MTTTLLPQPQEPTANAGDAIQNRLRDIFQFGPGRSLVHAVDDLLLLMRSYQLSITDSPGVLRIACQQDGMPMTTVYLETPRPLLRHIIARLVAIANERNSGRNSINVYGDRAILPPSDNSSRSIQMEFGNSQQTGVWLKSTPA